MLIHLYVKTHNVTGLKYFGRTASKNPYKYKGSGTYWTRHIKKYGYNVTTEIIGSYTNLEECKQVAVQFSVDNDIVKSKEWANLIIEDGTSGISSMVQNIGTLASLSDISRKKRKITFNNISHQQGTNNSQFGTMWITNGDKNKKIKKDADIPVGWHKGRAIKYL